MSNGLALAVKWLIAVLAIGGVITVLTVFDGWEEFLDITGLSEFEPKTVRTAPASQCESIRDYYGQEEVIRCAESDAAWEREVREECSQNGQTGVDERFLIGDSRAGEVYPPECP